MDCLARSLVFSAVVVTGESGEKGGGGFPGGMGSVDCLPRSLVSAVVVSECMCVLASLLFSIVFFKLPGMILKYY